MDRNSFQCLLRQDISIVFRNGYVHVVVGLAVLFILLVNFVLPSEIAVEAGMYFVDRTDGQLITSAAHAAGMEDLLLASETELQRMLEEERQAIGVVYHGSREEPGAIIYRQGNEAEETLRVLEATVISLWDTAGDLGRPTTHRTEVLRPPGEAPPFNLDLVPLLLTFESALIGLFFVAALVFQEKEEGSIRAFRVTPAGTWTYILSKITVNVLLSVLSALLLFIFTLGLRPELPAVLLLVVAVSFLLTAFGLTISVFFSSLSEFVYLLAVVMTVASLPIASYFMPSFSAAFFPLIPTYPLMFGIRELIFSTGRTDFYLQMLALLAAEILALIFITKFAVHRYLMREGH